MAVETGTERFTVTTWFEGTSVAPADGMVETTANGVGGTVRGGRAAAGQRRGIRLPVVATGDEGSAGHQRQRQGDTEGDPDSPVAPGRRNEDLVVGHGSKRSWGRCGGPLVRLRRYSGRPGVGTRRDGVRPQAHTDTGGTRAGGCLLDRYA